MQRVKTFRHEAKDFFWKPCPITGRSSWDGWDKFANPSLSSKLGNELLGALSSGLRHGNRNSLLYAINILETDHWKNVHVKNVHGPVGEVRCKPTEDGFEGARLLKLALCEIELEI